MPRLTALLFALLILSGAATAQVPHGVVAENCTATWCGYCPYAYQGLEVMKQTYDTTEFTPIRYYATSGDLGTPETNARIAYYGVNGFPTVVFDGKTKVVGGSTTIATGSAYDPIVAVGIGRPSPVKISVNSVSFAAPTGSIDLDVEVAETMADIGNIKIRLLILENDVPYGSGTHTDVTRDVLPDVALNVSQLGQVQNVSTGFAIEAGWNTSNLWIAILIQDDDTKELIQSASTRPLPDYSIRYWARGTRAQITPSSGTHLFGDFAVFNWGTQPDVIRVSLDNTTVPAGWDAIFTDGTDTYSGYVDLTLDPGESRVYHVEVTPNGSGYAEPVIVLNSNNLPGAERKIPFTLVTDDVDVLVVDDDGAESYEEYHSDGIVQSGKTYGVWNTNYADVTTADLSHFDLVWWEIGLSYPTLTASDRNALGAYLDSGGNLFITGQDLGWELHDEGGAAYAWYTSYLRVNYVADDANRNTLSGIPGDPISDGIALNLVGGDGAGNNEYPECILPNDGTGTVIFNYDSSSYKGAVRVDTGTYKVVYLGFPFESINNQDSRRLLIDRILDWMFVDPASVEDGPMAGLRIRAFPNPTAGGAYLNYALPQTAPVRLAIYGPDGSRVRTLVDGVQEAGPHSLFWDGRDSAGQPAASGVYFYRLEADGSTGGKLVLTR